MAEWCPSGDWNSEMIIERDCKARKADLGISDDTDCETVVFMNDEDLEWENDDADFTMCTAYWSMTEYCPGSLLQEISCGQSYDDSMLYIGMASETCDMIMPDEYVSFGTYLTNVGCCASIRNCFA